MQAIFYVNGTYVAVENSKEVKNTDFSLIISDSEYKCLELFGGRVKLSSRNYNRFIGLTIDGITIKRCVGFNNNSVYNIDYSVEVSFTMVASYLNQMEQLGVDTFLDNYKKELESVKNELKEYANALRGDLAEKEDDKKRSLLEKIENLLACIILPQLFSLSINMNAGLDNHVYQEAYDTLINTYFAE